MAWSRSAVLFLLVLLLSVWRSETLENRYILVKTGHDLTLPCEPRVPNHCSRTEWSYIRGDDRSNPCTESQREGKCLHNCSLRLHRVTEEQAGEYFCRLQDRLFVYYVSVAFLSQWKEGDRVTLNCSLATTSGCVHGIYWFNDIDELSTESAIEIGLNITNSYNGCWATLSFNDTSPPSPFYQTLSCRVLHEQDQVTLYPKDDLRPEMGMRTETASPFEDVTLNGTAPDANADSPSEDTTPPGSVLRIVLVTVGLSAEVLAVAAVHVYVRVKGSSGSRRSPYSRNRQNSGIYENVEEDRVSINNITLYM